MNKNLPQDKQYLETAKVPCKKRIAQLEAAASKIEEVDLDNGWVETGGGLKDEFKEDEMVMLDDAMQVVEGQDEQEEPQIEEKEMTLDEMMADADAEEAAGTVAVKAAGNIFA